MSKSATIIYTKTDEAPALATQSFLPIVKAFTSSSNIQVETRDISLAGRILSLFPEYLNHEQRVSDDLAELGQLVKNPEANIIKLPNISASVPQLNAAIKELQSKGYNIPDFPKKPISEEEKDIQSKYNKVKGSAVNPVLREGNSDSRAPKAVKNFAKNNPHSMGKWSSDSKTHVATMDKGDFMHNEKSLTISNAGKVSIVFTENNGNKIVLKDSISLLENEIIDASVLSKKELLLFLENQVKDAKEKNILFSLHMKATMMKVSDPIIFGHAVRVFFKDLFNKHQETFNEIGVNVNNGFGDLISNLSKLSANKKEEILSDIATTFENGTDLAIVNSDK